MQVKGNSFKVFSVSCISHKSSSITMSRQLNYKKKKDSPVSVITDFFPKRKKIAGFKTTGIEDDDCGWEPFPSTIKSTKYRKSIPACKVTCYADDSDENSIDSDEYVEMDTLDSIQLIPSLLHRPDSDERKRDDKLQAFVLESLLRYGPKLKIAEVIERHSVFDMDNVIDDSVLSRDRDDVYLHSKYPLWTKETERELMKINMLAEEKFNMQETNPCKTCGLYCIKDFMFPKVLEDLYRGDLLTLGKGHEYSLEYSAEELQRSMRNGAYKAFQLHIDEFTGDKLKGLLPECIVQCVHQMFPSPSGIHHGWPWNEQELVQLGHDPLEYAKEQEIRVNEMKQWEETKLKMKEMDAEDKKNETHAKDP